MGAMEKSLKIAKKKKKKNTIKPVSTISVPCMKIKRHQIIVMHQI